MKKLLALVGITILLFSSCNSVSGTKSEKVGGRASIMVPISMSVTNKLNEDAVFQMQNIFQELYIIVIEEDRQEFKNIINSNSSRVEENHSFDFKVYSDVIISSLEEDLDLKEKIEPRLDSINGLPASISEFVGVVNGLDIFYKHACVEGKDKYYQVLTWTLVSRKDKHLESMNAMINSFKEQ